MNDAKSIEGFPDYLVDKSGTVFKGRNGYPLRPSRTQEGSAKITLYKSGRPYTKSLALIVAKAWLYNDHNPEVFDTPIHLDNDPLNNHVDNLKWRPRWFAVKYQQQYWNEEYRTSRIRVRDEQNGEVFDSIMQPCQLYGLLFTDVINSCNQGLEVFPTWKKFSFA